MSSECLFNRLVKFHKMNVQIHSYRYCRVWNKKELGQMGLLKTPITVSGQAYEYETSWEYPNTVGDYLTTRAILWITRKALYSASQLPYDIVNKDVMDAELPNLFFVFESKKYGVYCDLKKKAFYLLVAVWRVRRESDVMIVDVVAVQTALPSSQCRGSIQRACDRR